MSVPRQTDLPSVPGAGAGWLVQGGEQQGLASYVEAVRGGRWLILVSVIACVGVALLYLAQADKVYEASVDLLVTPTELAVDVPGTIQPSSDPTRETETVARLARNATIARAVIERLKLDSGPQGVLGRISADPVASSNIVTITASGPTAQSAADLANAYSEEFVTYRTQRFHDTVDGKIAELEAQVNEAASQGASASLREQLAILEGLRGGDDPNVRVETPAEVPTGQVAPRPLFTGVAAVLGGLVIGLLGAFGLQILDPRLRREEQLRTQFRLPILARIPLERRRKARPLRLGFPPPRMTSDIFAKKERSAW